MSGAGDWFILTVTEREEISRVENLYRQYLEKFQTTTRLNLAQKQYLISAIEKTHQEWQEHFERGMRRRRGMANPPTTI